MLVLAATFIGAVATTTSAHVPHSGYFSGITGEKGCRVNVTDNDSQSYYRHGTDSRLWNEVLWTRSNNINPTDMSTSTTSVWGTTTDVGVYNADFSGDSKCAWQAPDGTWWWQPWCCEQAKKTTDGTLIPFLAAAAWVETLNAANEAEQHRLYFEIDNLNNNNWNQSYLRAIACHETGHTLGLLHSDGTCMVDPADSSQTGFSIYAGGQRDHINEWYPERSNP